MNIGIGIFVICVIFTMIYFMSRDSDEPRKNNEPRQNTNSSRRTEVKTDEDEDEDLSEDILTAENTKQQYHPYEITFDKTTDDDSVNLTLAANKDVKELQRICDAVDECHGFTSDGWLKSSLGDENNWKQEEGVDIFEKYLKTSKTEDSTYLAPELIDVPVDKRFNLTLEKHPFKKIKNKTVDETAVDLQHIPDRTPSELQAICNRYPNCAGFTSDGWLKESLGNWRDWPKKPGTHIYEKWKRTDVHDWAEYLDKGLINVEVDDRSALSHAKHPYKIIPGKNVDSTAENLQQVPSKNVKEMQQLCDALEDCAGFTSDGWLKKSLGKWRDWPKEKDSTIYEKWKRTDIHDWAKYLEPDLISVPVEIR